MLGRVLLGVHPRQMRAFEPFDPNSQRLSMNVSMLQATNGNHTGNDGFSASVPYNLVFPWLDEGRVFRQQSLVGDSWISTILAISLLWGRL